MGRRPLAPGEGGRDPGGRAAGDLHAVQACAAWFELRHDEGRTVTAALEITLVWREGEEVRRANLCRGHGNLAVIARRAQELADALDVAFLFHGRSYDWHSERRRARKRPPVKGGGIV